jgi:hypothetical protein
MAIAMTVGATKIKIIQENALASLPAKEPNAPQPPTIEQLEKQATCFT